MDTKCDSPTYTRACRSLPTKAMPCSPPQSALVASQGFKTTFCRGAGLWANLLLGKPPDPLFSTLNKVCLLGFAQVCSLPGKLREALRRSWVVAACGKFSSGPPRLVCACTREASQPHAYTYRGQCDHVRAHEQGHSCYCQWSSSLWLSLLLPPRK